VQPILKAPAGVEIAMRTSPTENFVFILNHTDRAVNLSLGEIRGENLLNGQKIARTIKVAPLDAAVIRQE